MLIPRPRRRTTFLPADVIPPSGSDESEPVVPALSNDGPLVALLVSAVALGVVMLVLAAVVGGLS